MQSAFDVQYTFLAMSPLTTAEHLSQSALELYRAETTISAPVEGYQENHNIFEQSASQQIGAHDNVPDDSSPNADADLVPTFADRIIRCRNVTVVDGEYTMSTEYHVQELYVDVVIYKMHP
jgi:hypothetical protein